jgi:hypothetical protein
VRLILGLPAALACAIVVPVGALAGGTATVASATPTPPPQIYRVVTTPFCARLHEKIRPAVSTILQNDTTIAKSLPLFQDYGIGAFGSIDAAFSDKDPPPMNDSINVDSPATRMALQKMSYLVSPIAQNLIAAQTLLDDPALLKPTGNPNDDLQLAALKKQLLETVGFQSASLDLVNGFVQTQQMGELQHAGETYLSAITGSGLSKPIATAPPPNLIQDPNSPGLPPNPFTFDPLAVPGLAVGYNPLNRLVAGLQWVRGETDKRESVAANSIKAALAECTPPSHPH